MLSKMGLIGVGLLLGVVPLRHVALDTSGPATALALALLAALALAFGFAFEWKSGWCAGLCPVHPVEQLYGSEPLLTVPNAHCTACERCVQLCPDSTPGMHHLLANKHPSRTLAGLLMAGGFAGFVWGWFQVPDYAGGEGWGHLGQAYALPFTGLGATLALFLLLRRLLPRERHALLVRAFAAAALACYYWYRLPALFGFGPYPGDGMLVDLRGTLPVWFPLTSRLLTTTLFAWWLVGRRAGQRSWVVRPAFA